MCEKRKFTRVPESSAISYRILPHSKSEHFMTQDVSTGGLRFFAHEFVAVKSLLEIQLIPEDISFSFNAIVQVKWVRAESYSERYEIGVAFVNPSAAKNVIRYMKSLVKKS